MDDLDNYRFIFRPTVQLKKKVDRLMATGRWMQLSECLREALQKGVAILEKEIK